MKRLASILLFALAAQASAQVEIWQGTNSQYAVRLIALGPHGAPTNHGLAKVWINGRAHPAQVYIGADGWRTLDYGAGVDPDRIKQFRILAIRATEMMAINDANSQFFTLHRQ